MPRSSPPLPASEPERPGSGSTAGPRQIPRLRVSNRWGYGGQRSPAAGSDRRRPRRRRVRGRPCRRNVARGANCRAGSSASLTDAGSSLAAWPVACARSHVCTRISGRYRSRNSPSGSCPPHGNGTGRASADGSSTAIMSARAARHAATGSWPAADPGSAAASGSASWRPVAYASTARRSPVT
jgi:hypothetical protein